MSPNDWPYDLPRSGRDAITFATEFLEESIFREYDVRGRVDPAPVDTSVPMNEFVTRRVGAAFGTWLHRQGIARVVVGYDGRSYSERLANGVTLGLLSCGLEVVNIGLATTPMVYFSQHELGGIAGVSVTASHNPNGWTGLKLATNPTRTLGPDQVAELKEIAYARDFVTGEGRYSERSMTDRYLAYLSELLPATRPMRVVVDGANSISAPIGCLALERAGYEVVPVNQELDWSFPNHEPDPEIVDARAQLREAVLAHDADLGVAFDGDGDRLGVTDDKGEIVWADILVALIARDSLSRHPGAPIVFDVKCSRVVPDVVREAGGQPVMWKTGHSLIKEKLQETGAPFAGERSGHFFDAGDYLGFDDGIYSALRFLRIVGESGRPVSELTAELPQYFNTPTMHADCPDADKYRVVEEFAAYAETVGASELVRVNGVRAEFPDGWLLVRASSNLPALVIVAEATSDERLREMYRLLREGLGRSPEVSPAWHNDPYA